MENGSGGDAFPTLAEYIGIGRYPGALGEAQAVYFANSPADPREEYVADAPEYGFNEFLQLGGEYGFDRFVLVYIDNGYSVGRAV